MKSNFSFFFSLGFVFGLILSAQSQVECVTMKLSDSTSISIEVLEIAATDVAYRPCGGDSLDIRWVSKKKVTNLKELKQGRNASNNKTDVKNELGFYFGTIDYSNAENIQLIYGVEFHHRISEKEEIDKYLNASFGIYSKSENNLEVKDLTYINGSIGLGWKINFNKLAIFPSINLAYYGKDVIFRSYSEDEGFGPLEESFTKAFGLLPELSFQYNVSRSLMFQTTINYGAFFNIDTNTDKKLSLLSTKTPSIGVFYCF